MHLLGAAKYEGHQNTAEAMLVRKRKRLLAFFLGDVNDGEAERDQKKGNYRKTVTIMQF